VTKDGISRFLGSGLIKGVGPARAKKIVDKFGLETLAIIENNINRLLEIDGIGEKWLASIQESFNAQKEAREYMPALQSLGITPAYCLRVYKTYGKDAVALIRGNPYRLTDISGIGFRKADEIAMKIGIPKESSIRAEAGVLFVLNEMAGEGHVYYPKSELIKACLKSLEINNQIIMQAIAKLTAEGKLCAELIHDGTFMGKDDAIYLSMYYHAEKGIAEKLKKLLAYPKTLILDAEARIEEIKKEINIPFTSEQLDALRGVLQYNVMVLTGGPGTGKTTLEKAIIRLFKNAVLMAPTGRAAKKMEEATGHKATTIHRGLEYDPITGGFTRNEKNPLNADLVVIDETTMKGCILSYQLLKAIRPGTTLLYIGDVDQLPSVDAGNTMKDMISSGVIKTIRLTHIHRQAANSMIITASHSIREGKMPAFFRTEGKQDLFFFDVAENEDAIKKVVSLVSKDIPEQMGYNAVNDIQVLSPIHKGPLGTINLNAELQKVLNPDSTKSVTIGKLTFKTGDKVLQNKNNRRKDVYNGDIGVVTNIDEESQEITVTFDSRAVQYDYSEVSEIQNLAYVITPHKAQGGQYPVTIIICSTSHYKMLQRNLFYTALTRAKSLAIFVGTKKALAIAIRNNKPQLRYSMLAERLRAA
jgi:exodeoxyribonuclease V alpha subunit